MRFKEEILKFNLLILAIALFMSAQVSAACGGNTRTWTGASSNSWNTNSNWSPANYPNTASEDVVIISSATNARMTFNSTVGCVDVLSGVLEGTQNRTLTVEGDYFSAPNANTLNFTSNNFKIEMGGNTPQIFEAVDDIRDLILSNPTSVTLKNNFRIRSDLVINSQATTYVEGDLWLHNTNVTTTIPAGHTLVIKNGASIFTRGNFIIEGVLKVEAGAELRVYRNKTLTVATGGVLQLLGASGNPARLVSESANRSFTFNMDGTLTANHFLIQRTKASGSDIAGTVTQMDNGEFRGLAGNGVAMTLHSTATMPSTLNTIGIFNDDDRGTTYSIDASAYNNGAFTVENFSGDVTSAQEIDPNNQVNWGSSATTELAILNDAETGEPQLFFDPGDEFTFAEFAFTLSQVDTSTDITEVQVSMTGSASLSDLEYVRAYLDSNGNCNFNANADTLIGDLSFSGSPAKATISITPGDLTTSSPTQQACLIIRAKASSTAVDQKTVKFGIISASDITNSAGYNISATSGTPIESNMTTIRNPNYSTWNGVTSGIWTDSNNWDGGLPSNSRDCHIGLASNDPIISTATVSCANGFLLSSGALDWNNSTNNFSIAGTLEVQNNFNFNNASSGVITMNGSSNQTISLASAFPGDLVINNTGTTGTNIITVSSNSTINGNLTCSAGSLYIPNGITLTVLGAINVNTGCELHVGSGGTLELANSQALNVNAGGKLKILGNSSSFAKITSNAAGASYTINVNGTIEARYYNLDHLGATGISIESGATIDSTNHLQDGSYTYPVISSSTFLNLKRQVPGNSLSNMFFDDSGSAAGAITNIDTTGAGAGALNIINYSGNLGGASLDNDPSYLISWSGETNTINLTRQISGPSTVTVGNTYNMGLFGLQQSLAGASYSDTELTSLTLTLKGNASASDINLVKIFADTNCDGTGGVLIGSGTFSGVPATANFNFNAGDFIIPADASAPAMNCFYVEYEISSSANDGSTVGAEITGAQDISNSLGYAFSATDSPPINLGANAVIDAPTLTIWNGTTSTNWNTATNWTAGVPDASKTCQIPNVANDPIISSGTATCQNVDITTGHLTLNSGATLQTYGNFSNAGSFTQSGTLEIIDGGINTNHSITSTDTLSNLTINKTGGGIVNNIDNDLTINSLSLLGGNFRINIGAGKKIIFPNGVSIPNGELRVSTGGILEIGSGQSLTVNGGIFAALGTNDSFPQNAANKAIIRTQNSIGRWSFSATSGTVNLSGFHIDYIDTNGINISGSTTVSALQGGQLTNLSPSYASLKAIQLNTSGTIPLEASNIAWTWGAFNSFNPANTGTPSPTDPYTLVSSNGCNGQTIDFTNWTGDWFESQTTFDVTQRVSATSCTINMASAVSSVSLRSLEAIAYNNAVDIRWETNTERNHLGFNIYRAFEDGSQYQQINEDLIRNINNAGQARGTYRFIDHDVTNGDTYIYYIEDVEISGKKTLHGPVEATPLSSLGNPPLDSNDDNNGSNPDDGDDGSSANPFPINNPSYKDLGDGVVIHNQTSTNLRLVITPTAPVFSSSAWDNTYQDVAIAGYSKTSIPGSPELPERILLIEVNPYATTASILNSSTNESALVSGLITPAPSWTMNGSGTLEATYAIDNTVYSSNSDNPQQYFLVDSVLESQSNKKYLRIKINPLKFNPATQDINFASKITLDISLDGNDWTMSPPVSNQYTTPFNVANTLKIDYEKAGFYQLSYDDLVSSSVEGPFEDANISDLRLYFQGNEIPIEIQASSSQFSSGDSIFFYAPYESSLEDRKNSLILSTVAIGQDSTAPLRIEDIDGDPTDELVAQESYSLYSKHYESSNLFVDGQSLKDLDDHFFAARLFNLSGYDTFTQVINLDEIDLESDYNVKIKLHVKGLDYQGVVTLHHMALSVNGVEELDLTFNDERQILTYEVPANIFSVGNNTLSFKLLGSFAAAGTYEQVYVDKVEVEFVGYGYSNGQSHFKLAETEVVHTIENFDSNNLYIYDITDKGSPKRIINSDIRSLDAGSTYNATFYVNGNSNDTDLKEIEIIKEGSFLSPTALSLSQGEDFSLKDTANRADYIIIGHPNLLFAIDELVNLRESQGLEVMLVAPSQIFGTFSHGQKTSQGIRDFLNYAADYWDKKPSYVLILGDGTTDPLDHNIDIEDVSDRSAPEEETLPIPFSLGRFQDFGTDNYFVTKADSIIPRMAIGRLPSNNPEDIRNYAKKVTEYERGETLPSDLKRITFVADIEQGYYEKFTERSQKIASIAGNFNHEIIDRETLGSDALTKSELISHFDNSPYIISLMGHGASNTFGTSILQTSDATSLSHDKMPIVLTWNCETAYYFHSAKYEESLSEKLIFNPNGGAIVFMGSTTQTTPSAQSALAENFFSALNGDLNTYNKGQRIGDYLVRAKTSTGQSPYLKDIVNSYSIIGDPAIKVPESMFPDKPIIQPSEQAPPSSGGGCSAFAGSGSGLPWYSGLLEYLICFVLLSMLRYNKYQEYFRERRK